MNMEQIIAEAKAAKKAYLLRETGAGARVLKIKKTMNALPEADRIAAYEAYNAQGAR